MRRPCIVSGCDAIAADGPRCRAHTLELSRARERARHRPPPSARGYGPDYRAERARILSDATVCYVCGRAGTAADPL